MQLLISRLLAIFLGYLVAQSKTYPMQTWPVYPQTAREYTDDDYYYAPKVQYYYDSPAMTVPEVYGQVPYPYIYDPYNHFANEEPKGQEERLAALPIGQETWFENEGNPRWRTNDDDVSAAFLDNLILTQMAQDAQRRRENARAAFSPVEYDEHEHEHENEHEHGRDAEDEDVRELKALAGKPLYHVPKTVPRIEDEDYPADDSFINWNGNKRSVTTATPSKSTTRPNYGQKEMVMTGPTQTTTLRSHQENQNKRSHTFYNNLVRVLAEKSKNAQIEEATKGRKIDKRFVAGDHDLVLELRELKHRIAT